MGFKKDLEFGKLCETFLITHLQPSQVEYAPKGIFKYWDLKLDGVGYECKTDRFTDKTGNICIEAKCNGKPSGITVTKATYYAYLCFPSEEFYIIPVEELRLALDRGSYHDKRRLGDGYRSECYLFKKELFNQWLIKCAVRR